MKNQILSQLTTECPWRDTLYWYDAIDSTNNRAKELALAGAPHGTVLVAGQQTGGRGRLGRSFVSAQGGLYYSVILRPNCPPQQLMHLTCAAGVAACDAVEAAFGFRPGIKWPNDLVCGNRKLGGILTELVFDGKRGHVQYAIIGIGVNCMQPLADFPPELQQIIISAGEITGKACSPAALAAAMTQSLFQMDQQLLTQQAQLLETYRADCINLGQTVQLHRQDTVRTGTALDVDAEGGLVVRYEDGTLETVTSGEVSVRGLYGYA